MDNATTFQIFIKRKIPYLSKGLWIVILVLFLIVGLVYLLMLPTKHASSEMAAVYYQFVIPYWLKKLSAIALVGLIIFMPLYFMARYKNPAILSITEDALFIKGINLDITIDYKNIKRIYFNDLSNASRLRKDKFQIAIYQTTDKTTIFQLANYDDADLAMESFSKIENIDFSFQEHGMSTMDND